MKPSIVVFGSLNMDFVVSVDALPRPGETVLGEGFRMIPGGKGGNQACAAGKLGTDCIVRMIGRTGNDLFSNQLKASLAASGVDVTAVSASRSEPTGVAFIQVDRLGQNSIVVASGANFAFPDNEVAGLRQTFTGSRYALFQLEIPRTTVAAGLRLARNEGATTILDPAPAQSLPRDFLELVDLLTPNESEACILLGQEPRRLSMEEAPSVARALRGLGASAVILKLGDLGCLYQSAETEIYHMAFPVEVLDSTAAGDTFNGALAVALAEGQPIESALRFANAAAALSVSKPGAQSSIPTRREVNEFLTTLQR